EAHDPRLDHHPPAAAPRRLLRLGDLAQRHRHLLPASDPRASPCAPPRRRGRPNATAGRAATHERRTPRPQATIPDPPGVRLELAVFVIHAAAVGPPLRWVNTGWPPVAARRTATGPRRPGPCLASLRTACRSSLR